MINAGISIHQQRKQADDTALYEVNALAACQTILTDVRQILMQFMCNVLIPVRVHGW